MIIEDLAQRQRAVVQQVLGPPERIAIDEHGNPTLPAIKFAEKVSLPVADLEIVDTEKGRYLSATIKDKGEATRKVLQTILPETILATPFPKTMRWSDLTISFARPIQSVLALLGKSVVPFSLEGRLSSGRYTWGHRFMHHKKIKIESAETYPEQLRDAHVVADIETRKEMVREAVKAEAERLGGRVLPDEDLLDIVTNLVELPIASGARFDDMFLELPPEILITSMREHQKYFAVVDEKNQLMPCFVAVNNTRIKDTALVAKGHQRVLRARLSDARFFYQADVKDNMEDWTKRLEGVLFQAKLGSMYAKIQRVEKIVGALADAVAPELKTNAMRAARLCKSDLVSQVVYEFTNLQGVMGRTYAGLAGEKPDVAAAIEEHYRPTYSGGPLPETKTGALLAIADKIDSICGCFSVGLIPTGASDPYALRRQGIGIVQIMLTNNFDFSLTETIRTGLKGFQPENLEETVNAVYGFVQNRIANMLADEGFAKDVIQAVESASVDHIPSVWQRVSALQQMKGDADFEHLAAAFKRVGNIIRKSDPADESELKESLLREKAEANLSEALEKVRRQVSAHLETGDFQSALRAISTLRAPVDGFFDDVMVMCDDADMRRNRLALLRSIASLLNQIADISKIAT